MFGINFDPAKKKGDDPQFDQIAPLQIPGQSSAEETNESPVVDSSGESHQEWGDQFLGDNEPASSSNKNVISQEIPSDEFGGSLFGFDDADDLPVETTVTQETKFIEKEVLEETNREFENMSIDDEEDFGFDEIDDAEIDAIDLSDDNESNDDVEEIDSDNTPELRDDLPEDSYWDALDEFHWKETGESDTAQAVADDAIFDGKSEEKFEKKISQKKKNLPKIVIRKRRKIRRKKNWLISAKEKQRQQLICWKSLRMMNLD